MSRPTSYLFSCFALFLHSHHSMYLAFIGLYLLFSFSLIFYCFRAEWVFVMYRKLVLVFLAFSCRCLSLYFITFSFLNFLCFICIFTYITYNHRLMNNNPFYSLSHALENKKIKTIQHEPDHAVHFIA
ncbi:uncharacterized protein BYT42DRAFT_516149, partial [Radiomyces spectabilis]|uniref:uncharacterized protein n=1 Tax=Radiomyces spectabilis TaxID=64574 RepID=UPI00221FDFE9